MGCTLRHCLIPCMCMMIEHILYPSRLDTGEPSLHDGFGSDVPAPPMSPLEEMKMYCGLAAQEAQITSHMELEQEHPSQATQAGIRSWQRERQSQGTLS